MAKKKKGNGVPIYTTIPIHLYDLVAAESKRESRSIAYLIGLAIQDRYAKKEDGK